MHLRLQELLTFLWPDLFKLISSTVFLISWFHLDALMRVFQSEAISSSTTIKIIVFFLITMSLRLSDISQSFQHHQIRDHTRFNFNWYPNFTCFLFVNSSMSFCQTFDSLLWNSPFLAKIYLFRKLSNCQGSLVCHLICILFKPFMCSSQIYYFPKNLPSS